MCNMHEHIMLPTNFTYEGVYHIPPPLIKKQLIYGNNNFVDTDHWNAIFIQTNILPYHSMLWQTKM